MKLAKKVLSVLLAVVIALGAFAVVGSAGGNPDGDYQVKVWLTGTVGTVNWTSATRVTMTETGDESAAGDTIEVQPGDTVFVRFYITNNYYVSQFQTHVFYSAGLRDANEIWQEQRKSTSNISTAALKKIHVWNEDHYFVELHGTSYSAQNPWTMLDAGIQTNVEQNWPTDDEGNNLFNMSEWKFARFNNLATDGVGETCIWDDDSVHLFMMPLTIPADAEPGDTFYVSIPEGTEQRTAKRYGPLRLYENGIAEGESEVNEIVDVQAQLNPNFSYDETKQYWDLSEATLTLQVPGEAGVDTSTLEEKLEEAAGLLTKDITADSKAALNEAITAGNDALTSDDQTTVDNAVTDLQTAIDAVKYLADFAALNEQISRYDLLDEDAYDATSFANATAKYNDAKAIDQANEADQDKVDAAAAALKDAIDNLAAALDYSALEAKYNELVGKDVANYTDDTVARFNAALAAAKSLIDNKNAIDQDEIDAAYNELVAANTALTLKAANYDALNAAIDKYVALNAKDWTSTSYAAATEKYEAAKAIKTGLDITAQDTIDAAAQALEDAITALVPATGADYSELNAAKAEFVALVEGNYTSDSYAAAKAAYDAACEVPADLTSEQQAQIDEAAAALNKALDELVEADADYTAVNAAKAAAAAKVAENDQGTLRYTDDSIAAINDAVAAVVDGLKKKDQATVDGYAAAINEAIANAEYRPYDYTKINDHIAAIEAEDADYYVAEEYAAYLEAKNALVLNYTHEQFAKAKLQEINFLKVKPTAAPAADYSAVEAAQAAFEAKKAAANYTADSIAAVEAELAKVNYDLNANHQDEVDAYAEAINAAIDKMVEIVVELADYAALDKAIADAAGYAAADYTAASYAVLAEKVAAGEDLARDLVKDDQAIVDAAAQAIVDAIAGLEKKADYTALDAAIAEGDGYDPNVWTEATYAVLADAVAAGRAVDRELGESSQAIIDEATAAIKDAISKMERKPVLSSIGAINWTPSVDTHNTFSVVVNGRPSMIQFIEEEGGTRTYNRYHDKVTIKSYNAAGEEVNSLSRDVAYEVWEIYTNLIGPKVEARAKYLEGTSYRWETETYKFEVETLEPTYNAGIVSVTPSATSGKKGGVSTVVEALPETQAIRFVMADGTTTTYSAAKAVVLENGNLQFTGKAWMNFDGANTVNVQYKVAGKWTDSGFTVEYTVE